jgi:hypothetical protein
MAKLTASLSPTTLLFSAKKMGRLDDRRPILNLYLSYTIYPFSLSMVLVKATAQSMPVKLELIIKS